MAIEGALQDVSLADICQLLGMGMKTGCLSITDRSNFGYIYFEMGRVIHASVLNRADRLGELLVRNHVLTRKLLSEAMERQGWQRSVYVQDEGERVRIYMRFDDTRMSGMTVMVTDDTEAVFVSVAGQIDPAVLGRVAGTLGINGVLDSLGGVKLNGQAP